MMTMTVLRQKAFMWVGGWVGGGREPSSKDSRRLSPEAIS